MRWHHFLEFTQRGSRRARMNAYSTVRVKTLVGAARPEAGGRVGEMGFQQ